MIQFTIKNDNFVIDKDWKLFTDTKDKELEDAIKTTIDFFLIDGLRPQNGDPIINLTEQLKKLFGREIKILFAEDEEEDKIFEQYKIY